MASTTSAPVRASPSRLRIVFPDLPKNLPTRLTWTTNARMASLSVPHRSYRKFRNINLIPIDYAFLPRLRADSTLRRLTLRRKPWLSAEGFHPLIVTHVSIRTSDTSSMPHSTPSTAYRTLLYHALNGIRSFGTQLKPR